MKTAAAMIISVLALGACGSDEPLVCEPDGTWQIDYTVGDGDCTFDDMAIMDTYQVMTISKATAVVLGDDVTTMPAAFEEDGCTMQLSGDDTEVAEDGKIYQMSFREDLYFDGDGVESEATLTIIVYDGESQEIGGCTHTLHGVGGRVATP